MAEGAQGEKEAEAPLRPGEAELRRLVALVRQVIDRSVLLNAPPEIVARASVTLERLLREMEPHTGKRAFPMYGSSIAGGDVSGVLPYSPIVGWLNPLAPPLELSLHGDRIEGHVRFGAAYEGPPSSVHGAIVAAVFDQALAIANIALGRPAMTASLTTHYRRPTPLYTDLFIEAHTDRVDGRKVYTKGSIRAGDTVTAEAEGLFIQIDFLKAAEMFPGRELPK